MESRPAAARPPSIGSAAGSRPAFRGKLSHGFDYMGGRGMNLASLSTSDWHARAAAVRYETGHFIDGKFVDSVAKGRPGQVRREPDLLHPDEIRLDQPGLKCRGGAGSRNSGIRDRSRLWNSSMQPSSLDRGPGW